MILRKGNMWDAWDWADVFMITTNPIIRRDGAVVMGRGIAKEAKDLFPTLPYDFGKVLQAQTKPRNVGRIGIYKHTPIFYFMVKNHWAQPAQLKIIEQSVVELNELLSAQPDITIALNFPGIGNGGLDRKDVLPLLNHLADNVHIWEYDD